MISNSIETLREGSYTIILALIIIIALEIWMFQNFWYSEKSFELSIKFSFFHICTYLREALCGHRKLIQSKMIQQLHKTIPLPVHTYTHTPAQKSLFTSELSICICYSFSFMQFQIIVLPLYIKMQAANLPDPLSCTNSRSFFKIQCHIYCRAYVILVV